VQHVDIRRFLEYAPDHGFPPDYLLSRLRGRKSRLVADWDLLVKSTSPMEKLLPGHYQMIFGIGAPAAVWRALMAEYRWVYHQMNGPARKTFAPFFLYGELRTLFICLRYLKGSMRDRLQEVLSVSLLSSEIKDALLKSPDELSAARKIEEILRGLFGRFNGITGTMKHAGLKDFEQKLAERFLSVMISTGLDPLLKIFFLQVIDARNILALAKLMKMGATSDHPFISGGGTDAVRLREILDRRDVQAADKIVQGITGEKTAPADLSGLERSLYRGISRSLKRSGRGSLGTGPVLDYLWRCSVEAMNLSILSQGTKLARDIVAAELVR
jgi:vacuolar-type H+-ATPase subunit C/Vma6